MSKLASILLILLTFALGGVQMIVNIDQRMAHQRAIKFQKLQGEQRVSLDLMTLCKAEFATLRPKMLVMA